MSTASKSKAPADSQRQLLILGGIAAVAVVAVIILIAFSGQASGGAVDYANIQATITEDGGFMLGDPNAPVTIVEFADFACPACQQYFPQIEEFIQQEVATGRANFEYRVIVTAGRETTQFVGGIIDCIGRENPANFWRAYPRFHQLATQGRYPEAARTVAEELGLNYADLLTCQQESTWMQQNQSLASQVGVEATPAVRIRFGDGSLTLIGPEYARGGVPLDVLKAVVASAQPS